MFTSCTSFHHRNVIILIYFINYYVIILCYCKYTNPWINLTVYPSTYPVAFLSFFNHDVIFAFLIRLYVFTPSFGFLFVYLFFLCCYLLHWSKNNIPTAIYQ